MSQDRREADNLWKILGTVRHVVRRKILSGKDRQRPFREVEQEDKNEIAKAEEPTDVCRADISTSDRSNVSSRFPSRDEIGKGNSAD